MKNRDEIVSYEEFREIMINIFNESESPETMFTQGYSYLDREQYLTFNFI